MTRIRRAFWLTGAAFAICVAVFWLLVAAAWLAGRAGEDGQLFGAMVLFVLVSGYLTLSYLLLLPVGGFLWGLFLGRAPSLGWRRWLLPLGWLAAAYGFELATTGILTLASSSPLGWGELELLGQRLLVAALPALAGLGLGAALARWKTSH